MGQELREDDPLWVQRVILCDLLIGRWMRGNAEKVLRRGLEFEKLARTESFADGWQACVDQELDAAVGIERIAVQSERGQVLWGGRFNRHGQRPDDYDSPAG